VGAIGRSDVVIAKLDAKSKLKEGKTYLEVYNKQLAAVQAQIRDEKAKEYNQDD
jgi:hypothetical protein